MNGSRYRDVPSPARTDGIGIALQRAFAPMNSGGQDDFTNLLQEIDRRTA